MVANNIKNVFRSRAVQQIVKTASEKFGIEEASIHPVKNYVDDFDILNEMNIPLLIALRQAKNYAEDRIEYVLQHKEGQ
jgi:3-deoxy-D-manno-octulosonate 8-phosphate phosphatase KdsC-like HAD superfamily phosphatase